MDLFIENATLLDLDTGELHGGSAVRVEGDRIAETARTLGCLGLAAQQSRFSS